MSVSRQCFSVALCFLLMLSMISYLQVQHYHNTWVLIRYVLQFLSIEILQVLQFNMTIYCDFCLLFQHYTVGKG